MHRFRVAAVLAADAEPQIGPGPTTLLYRYLHQPPHAVDVERLERRYGEHALLQVRREESGLDVVTREAPRGLRQVVRAEREELCSLSDPERGQGRARELDHRPDGDMQLDALALRDVRDYPVRLVADQVQLHQGADERHHDLHLGVTTRLDTGCGRFHDRPNLEGKKAWYDKAEPHSAQTEHRVGFVQPLDGRKQPQVTLVRRASLLR